jgi:hypothetical protein
MPFGPVTNFLLAQKKIVWASLLFWFQKRKHSQLALKCSRLHIEMNYEKFKRSDRPDRFCSLTFFSPLLGKSFSMITKLKNNRKS